MRARVAMLLAMALVLSACAAAEIELMLEEFAGEEFAISDDPGVRAAGDSALELERIQGAEEQVESALGEPGLDYVDRRTALDRAQELRPDDPRYDLYEAVFHRYYDVDGREGQRRKGAGDSFAAAGSKLVAARPDVDVRSGPRVMVELYADTLLDFIRRFPQAPGHPAAVGDYCRLITVDYVARFAEEFPSETAFYLAVSADRSVC